MNQAENCITAISVGGFKSIGRKLRLAVKPLTILAGANSSGKSSVIQPALLLKQTVESLSDPGVFQLNGPNVRFTSADQLLSRTEGKAASDSFTAGFALGDGTGLELTYKRVHGEGFQAACMDFTFDRVRQHLTTGLTHNEIGAIAQNWNRKLHPATGMSLPPPVRFRREQTLKSSDSPTLPIGEWRWKVIRQRCFLTFGMAEEDDQSLFMAFPIPTPSSILIPLIQGTIHVPALRGNPERSYQKRGAAGPNFPGTFENYVASLVTQWQVSQPSRLSELGEWLKDLGLTWKVDARPLDDTQVELRVGRLLHGRRGTSQDMVNIADVGFGVSQVLPVLVALLAAHPGQLVYLEQPEIHLHPRAQRRLGVLLAAAAQRGVRVVVETHSALLLREIQTLVATAKLAADLVKLHWFKRDPEDGVTELFAADLDKNGAYGDWPEDFDETHLASEKAYLDAVEEKTGFA